MRPPMVTWIEPFGPDAEPVYMFVTKETAIAYQKDCAWVCNEFQYDSDQQALEDFITVHLATII